MLAVWSYVEADFRRDYGIRLTDELPHMSWREFQVLLKGLSPFGAVATHYEEAMKQQREKDAEQGKGPDPNAARFWAMITSLKQPKSSS